MMTVGGVSVPGWPWAYLVVFLALYGLLDLCLWAAGRLRGLAGRVRWWLRDRVAPLLEDEDACPVCGRTDTHEWECPVAPELDPLPPEQSAEDLGLTFRRAQTFLEHLEVQRERLASTAESFHRAQYAALDLEYPSGLLAKVREAAP